MRVYRIIATAAAAVVVLVVPSASVAQTLPIRATSIDRTAVVTVKKQVSAQQQKQLRSLTRKVARFQVATWQCQDQLGAARTRASVSPWALPVSIPYRTWVQAKWKTRAATCERSLLRRSIPLTNDWQTSVRLVQRIYPGTSSWLLYISHREGGHGGFVMNHQGSGAGGWMQFMSSTYYAYNDAAFADARSRGFIVPSSANSWTHPLGQAITAGYMRFTGRDGCHWCL